MAVVMKLIPAELAFDAAGTPWSPEYADIYHSADSGPGQARHVFLGGNQLPARWSGQRVFTIVETGFGIGINFLATWLAWRDDASCCERLHYVSIEKRPFTRDALAQLHARYAELAPLAAQLRAAWPQLVPGLHRLEFEAGRVTLTLAFADAADALPQLRLSADAIFLDGFSPAKNPAMWTPKLMKALARNARPGATLATYTSARPVRDALEAAGFEIGKRPGFGHKRDMLAARYQPRWKMHHAPAAAPAWPERHAIVIGAGLAGAAACERLAARGWRIDLVERESSAAAGASGMHAGAFHPHVSRDDSVLSRLTRAGFLYALGHWQALAGAGHPFAWQRCGLLQLAAGQSDEGSMAETVDALGYPASFAGYADCQRACALAGLNVRNGGWWFPAGGWMRPAELIGAQIAAARASPAASVDTHFGSSVDALVRDGDRWRAMSAGGDLIAAAPVVVLANAHDAARLAPMAQALRSSRGQVAHLPAHALANLRAVLTGAGYLLPAIGGISVAGTTYDFDDDDASVDSSGQEDILERAGQMLADRLALSEGGTLPGAVGFRCVAPDRMPMIGALPDLDAARAAGAEMTGAHLADLPRMPGLYSATAYASRGLIWAAIGGELLASVIEGEPQPVESGLADAIDPGRYALKLARRGRL